MGVHKAFFALILLFFLWLAGKFLLPFLFPFLLGTALALAAEPVVRLGTNRLRIGRGIAAGIGITLTLVLLAGIVFFLGALLVRELSGLARQIPPVMQQSTELLEDALVSLCQRAPEPVGTALTGSVHRFFENSAGIADQAVQKVPAVLSGVLGKVSGSAVSLGTGVLSSYFISPRLPKLQTYCRQHLPSAWKESILPTLRHLKHSLGKWLLAQGKLMAITYGIVSAGLLLLKIPYAFAWAVLVAAVDAIPLLGTGTVLLPWALTKLLQSQPWVALGLTILYLAAMVTRTILEPRFYGRHLGLDPLVTLIFLYFGYRLWGFTGIILSPLLAATTKALTEQ